LSSLRERSLGLRAVDELFMTGEERIDEKREKVYDVSLSEIDDFPDHPFRVVNDDAMSEMVESVKQQGILVPAIARKKEDGRYELISGHRRKMACQLAGMETMPVIVRDIDRDAATLIMVDSNLQREVILPSEKAFSYKMRLEAMKRQAGRPSKENSSPVGINFHGIQSMDVLGDKVGESRNQIHRYIRLTELIKPILNMVDEGKIAMRPAVEISYLPKEEQEILFSVMDSELATPSLSQAQRIRQLSAEGHLTEDSVYVILSEQKPNQKEKYSFQRERLRRYIPDNLPENKVEGYVIEALEYYAQIQQRKAAARKNGAR